MGLNTKPTGSGEEMGQVKTRKNARTDAKEDPQLAERRPRAKTLLVAECRRADGAVHKFRIRDLSATGLRGDCPDVPDFEIGEDVRIRFPNLAPVRASIVRSQLGELAVTFEHAVDLEQIARARAKGPRLEQSPRHEVVQDWLGRTERERQWINLQRGIKGVRPI